MPRASLMIVKLSLQEGNRSDGPVGPALSYHWFSHRTVTHNSPLSRNTIHYNRMATSSNAHFCFLWAKYQLHASLRHPMSRAERTQRIEKNTEPPYLYWKRFRDHPRSVFGLVTPQRLSWLGVQRKYPREEHELERLNVPQKLLAEMSFCFSAPFCAPGCVQFLQSPLNVTVHLWFFHVKILYPIHERTVLCFLYWPSLT